MQVSSRHVALVILDPEKVSVKRLAWAFGCAKKDTEEEVALYRILVERIEKMRGAR